MYAEKLKQFEKKKNLGDKAYQHAVAIDLLEQVEFDDCSMHYFHYQQMFEMLFKHLLETKTEFGAYPHSHKLNRLLTQLVKETGFKVDSIHYFDALNTVTICAETYRYNFLIDCSTYKLSVELLNPLFDELVEFMAV